MANMIAQRYLTFSDAKDTISFEEFLTNFEVASSAVQMTDEEKKATFFSHFDGKGLTYLYQNPELRRKTFDEAVDILTKHFVRAKTFNPAKIAGMMQQPHESVYEFLRRMKEIVYPLTEVKVNTDAMTPDELAILRIQKETRIAQAQEFIKPHFINGIRKELRPQLPSIYNKNLKDMVKELSRWESFQREHPNPDIRNSYVAMIGGEEEETPQPKNTTFSVPADREEEEKRNLMFAEFAKWWNAQPRPTTDNFQEWQDQIDRVPRRGGKKPKRFNSNPNYGQFNNQAQQAQQFMHHIHNVAVNPPMDTAATPTFSPHSMLKAAEILNSLNPSLPSAGLLPTPSMPTTSRSTGGYPAPQSAPYPVDPQQAMWTNYQQQPQQSWRDEPPRSPFNYRSGYNNYGANSSYGGNNGYPRNNNYNANYPSQGYSERPRFNDQQPQSDRFCTYCRRYRHTVDWCFDRKRDELAKAQQAGFTPTSEQPPNPPVNRRDEATNNQGPSQYHQQPKNGSGRPTQTR
jgi:hypothetical protein